MGWTVANPTIALVAGTRVRVQVEFRNPPFTGPDAQQIRQAVDGSTALVTESASESILTSVTPGIAAWDVTGIVNNTISITELSSQVTQAIGDLWNAFSVYVKKVEVESFEFPQPSTSTAVSLAAIAILALLGFYLLWRLKIV